MRCKNSFGVRAASDGGLSSMVPACSSADAAMSRRRCDQAPLCVSSSRCPQARRTGSAFGVGLTMRENSSAEMAITKTLQ